MRQFRIHVDHTGFIVQEKGWFRWRKIFGDMTSKEQAQFIIDKIKDQPK